MGTYSIINPSGKKRYGVMYSYIENGEKKYRRKIIGSKKDAEAEWDRIKSGDLVKGIFKDITQQEIPSFACASDLYFQNYGNELKSRETVKSHIKKFKKLWGSKPINEITKQEVSEYAHNLLKGGKAIATVSREIILLGYIFDWIKQHEGFDIENPARGIIKFVSPQVRKEARIRAEEKSFDYWEMRDIQKLMKASNGNEKLIIQWAYNSLMRKGEIQNARWEDIERDRKLLRIPKTKTDSPRTIPFRGTMHDILDELGWKDSGPIFPKSSIFTAHGFQELEKRAGLQHKEGRGFHKLRASGASHMMSLGVDYHTIAKLGGWKNLNILQRHYDKLGRSPIDQANAIERLGELLQILCRSEEAPRETVNIQLPEIKQEFPF